jgi:hypothetical protein
MINGAAFAAPAIPAAESTLGSHPCVALSSAQVLPEWINPNPTVHDFSADGANPLNSCLSPGVQFIPLPLPLLPPPLAAARQKLLRATARVGGAWSHTMRMPDG